MNVLNLLRTIALALLLIVSAVSSAALPYAMVVTEIEMGDNTIVSGEAVIAVRGSVTPALPCASQAILIYSTDPFQKEVIAMMLTAKATGQRITFNHVFCHASGYSRANGYTLQ